MLPVSRLTHWSTSMLLPIPIRPKTLRMATCGMSVALLAGALVAAQGTGSQPTSSGKSSSTRNAKSARSLHSSPAAYPSNQPSTAATTPAPPPLPAWPANEQAKPAQISWDSHGLKIEATNSSLGQILNEISTDTGTKVEGFNRDQRVFGTYGPGPAREVLSELFDGSGYNVLMVGGQGDAPPSRIVLSISGPAGPQPPPNTQSQSDEDIEAEQPPPEQPAPQPPPPMPQQTPQPTPLRNPFGGGPPLVPMPGQVPQDQQQQQPNQSQLPQ